jgi:nicotinamidase-related amidase
MLVIIDLQDYYLDEFMEQRERYDSLIEKLQVRVKEAMLKREPIINMTCWHDGCTLPEVSEMIRGYAYKRHVGKTEFDGSQELHHILKMGSLDTSEIELCGAFKDVCVLDTWKGLKGLGYNVLPVDDDLVIPTPKNWRGISVYPDGYLRRRDDGAEHPRGESEAGKDSS